MVQGGQASSLRRWLEPGGYSTLHFKLPIQIVKESGTELNAVIDCLAEGDGCQVIVDHMSGPASDLETRFLTYWPQLSAHAEAVQRVFRSKPVQQVAVNWMNERGNLDGSIVLIMYKQCGRSPAQSLDEYRASGPNIWWGRFSCSGR